MTLSTANRDLQRSGIKRSRRLNHLGGVFYHQNIQHLKSQLFQMKLQLIIQTDLQLKTRKISIFGGPKAISKAPKPGDRSVNLVVLVGNPSKNSALGMMVT